LQSFVQKCNIDITHAQLLELVDRTLNFSCADLAVLVREAAFLAIREEKHQVSYEYLLQTLDADHLSLGIPHSSTCSREEVDRHHE
jgi:ATP-dependent 26S proteasome regulatory subunit